MAGKKLRANARPTKEFFVNVLGKDISLIPAIVDLVDNSVDGARRLRSTSVDPTDTESFKSLWIKIDTEADRFAISDNCGGIPVPVARKYAFRFGRPTDLVEEDYEFPEFATGQFGVGMKRALFKLGEHFKIRSATGTSRFTMDVDVEDWLEAPGQDWHFDLENVQEGVRVRKSEIGTDIEVFPLHATIADDLSDKTVIKDLRTELRQRHMMSIHKGLTIELNGSPVRPEPPELIDTEDLAPAYQRFSVNGGPPIRVDILCGVADRPAREAGWSVFLNDRMVLLTDTSALTGWGDQGEKRIPRFHNQYGRFRGFAFLSCIDTTRLPWDTTKTGLDVDRPIYREVENSMVALMEPVIRFLDDVDKETTQVREGEELGPLLTALEGDEDDLFAVLDRLARSKRKAVTREFKRPAKAKPESSGPPEQSIQFRRPKSEIDVLKDYFEVRSATRAGESAWEFVFQVEDL